MIKLLFKILLLLVLLSPLALVGVLILSLQQQSIIDEIPVLKHEDVKKARAILGQHDPRKLRSGSINELQLDEQSLSLIGTYAMQTLVPPLSSSGMQAQLTNNLLALNFSVLLPANPAGRFFNLRLELDKQQNALHINKLQLGNWQLPSWMTAPIPGLVDMALTNNEIWQLINSALVNYEFNDHALAIVYRWQSSWEKLARSKMLELTDQDAMSYYAGILFRLSYAQRASFDTVVTSLFKQAANRSTQNNAIEENRAVIQLLGQWALGKQTYGQWYLPYFSVRLNNRVDLAQHLLVSAAISSHSTSEFSNLIGTSKEIDDSDGGSGFSFSDLAADRAGTLLGKLAVVDNSSAIKVQQLLSDKQVVMTLLPDITSLPAPLTEQQFKAQFGSIKDPRYVRLVAEIDQMISSTEFFTKLSR